MYERGATGYDTTPRTTYSDVITGLIVGQRYRITFEILRNDLSHHEVEFVAGATVDGDEILKNELCFPDGGDYDCTFFR